MAAAKAKGHKSFREGECNEQGEEAESSFASAVQIALGKTGVNIQKHLTGTLQGVDCRRMLERRAELLALLHAAIMDAECGEVEADAFMQRAA